MHVAPERVEKLVLTDDALPVMHQVSQKIQDPRLEGHRLAAQAKLALGLVQLEGTDFRGHDHR